MDKNQTTFWDHLEELREKVIRSLYVFFSGFIILYFFSDKLLDLLRKPLFQFLPPEKQHLYYTGLFENFFVHLKVAAYSSIIFLSPVYFWIFWKFLSPGLYEKERKIILPFVFASSLFFIFGSGFAYFFLFPMGVKYFLTYGTSAEVAMLTLESYVSLVLRVLIGFGFCFQLPVALVLLVKVGILTPDKIAKNRKYVFIAITIISALVAPPDAISMLLLMAPLYILFEFSLWVSKRISTDKY